MGQENYLMNLGHREFEIWLVDKSRRLLWQIPQMSQSEMAAKSDLGRDRTAKILNALQDNNLVHGTPSAERGASCRDTL